MGRRYDIMRDAALREKGRDWRNLIVGIEITRMVAPWAAGAVVLGALGYGAWWVWANWLVPAFAPGPEPSTVPSVAADTVGAVPGWLWLAAVAVVAALVWILRPGRIVFNPQRRVVELAGLAFVAAGIVGFGLFGITH